jgi:hypothetical protein
MDGSRFDQIARGMATGSARRTLLKGLGGGVSAALELIRASGEPTPIRFASRPHRSLIRSAERTAIAALAWFARTNNLASSEA